MLFPADDGEQVGYGCVVVWKFPVENELENSCLMSLPSIVAAIAGWTLRRWCADCETQWPVIAV